jgi:hypothetical protein
VIENKDHLSKKITDTPAGFEINETVKAATKSQTFMEEKNMENIADDP